MNIRTFTKNSGPSLLVNWRVLLAGLALLATAEFTWAHSIGDRVWHDLDRNGIQDGNEPGINGVVVEVYDCANNQLLAVQTTRNHQGMDGYYLFEEVVQHKTVYLRFILPAGFAFTTLGLDNSLMGADLIDSDVDPATGLTACTPIFCTPAEDWLHCQQRQWDAGLVTIIVATNPGTGTPGYWKNHPNAWPVNTLQIGGVVYTKAEALQWMRSSDGDKSVTLFRALASAKLNVLIGNDDSCITDALLLADAWFDTYGPVGSNIKGKSEAWKLGEPIYDELDDYNNGLLCAPPRD